MAGPADTDYVNQRRPPKQLRARLTRQHLLDAARRVFGESGYAAATVDDVARAAGCSKGAYYFHFTTKEEALLAAAEDWSAGQTRRLEEASERSQAPEAALSGVLAALFDTDANTKSERLLVLELWLQAARNPAVRAVLDQARGSWRRILGVAFARARVGVPDAAADLALAFHDGLLAQACLDGAGGATHEERVASALAMLATPRTLRRTA
jgi:AcrR family transcriptional regulator